MKLTVIIAIQINLMASTVFEKKLLLIEPWDDYHWRANIYGNDKGRSHDTCIPYWSILEARIIEYIQYYMK